MPVLEIACFSLSGVQIALQAGADRIELCENPHDGGTTPSYGMLKTVRALSAVPVFPILRPRGGDFCYSKEEVQIVSEDIQLCKTLGFEGVVLGCLHTNGQVHEEVTARWVEEASPMQVTFHRAFDRSRDPFEALEVLIRCGCKRVLSSGHRPDVMQGLPVLQQLHQQAAGRIGILPGGGLNSSNLSYLRTHLPVQEWHTAARRLTQTEGLYRNPKFPEDLQYTSVMEEEVRQLKQILAASSGA